MKLMCIAKAKDKSSKNLTHVQQIKSADRRVLSIDVEIKQKWYKYFRKLLNEEYQRRDRGCGISNENVIPGIARDEMVEALNRMKNGNSVGPDGRPVDVWKTLGEKGVNILWQMMSRIYEKEMMLLNVWRER
ncbi:uncharacterized protein [Diabrotica undecimpunctata]|uniref:uncharacterized protein n=1 Tax=Diabrotica undecimpunctata TaxID=50387 RepID=UPI003B63A035